MSNKYQIYAAQKGAVTPVIPELAKEIGLNESIMLVQIAYWITICDHEKDGDYWTYQSIRDMRKTAFPYWGVATINRVIQSLETKKLIKTANYNKAQYDKTRWFALNTEGLLKLKSVIVAIVDHGVPVPLWNNPFQSETRSNQNGTTIPYMSANSSTDSSSKPAAELVIIYSPKKTAKKPTQPDDTQSMAKSLIQAWADTCGLFGTFDTRTRLSQAKKMLAWDKPPTVEELQQVVRERLKIPRKGQYEFGYVAEDIIEWRQTLEREAKARALAAEQKNKIDDKTNLHSNLMLGGAEVA